MAEPAADADTAPDASRGDAEPADAPAEPQAAQKSTKEGAQQASGGSIWWVVAISGLAGALTFAAVFVYFMGGWSWLMGSGDLLTPATWDQKTAGKTVFVKFFAPWCGHCKKMKPDWDKLMAEYKDSPTILVADVDCIGSGKALCSENGVKSFPTIKYGDPTNLEDYSGKRTLKELREFASNLKPSCGPDHLEFCDEGQKGAIAEFQAMSPEKRQEVIDQTEAAIAAAGQRFEASTDKLKEQYDAEEKKKEEAIQAIKDSGLAILKAISTKAKKKAEL